MLRHPALQDRYRALVVDGEGVVLLSDDDEAVLRGSVYEQVIPLLDGRHTADEIAERLSSERLPAEVYHALGRLEARGHLVERARSRGESRAAAPVRAGVAARQVALRVLGGIPESACAAALAAHGSAPDDTAPVLLVVTDSYLRPELADLNERALRTGRPWLLVQAAGSAPWVGPLLQPGATCCWRCLADRLTRNRPVERHIVRAGGARPVVGLAPQAAGVTLAMAAVAGLADEALAGVITVLDPRGGVRHHERVARRPQCPVCGDGSLYTRQAVTPRAPGARWPTPAAPDSAQHLEGLVLPLTGVVHDVRSLPTSVSGLVHVAVARYGNDGGGDRPLLERDLRQASGKGTTPAAARTSALAEAIERYSAVAQGDEPMVRATRAELGDAAIDPDACMQFSAAQYADRAERNRRAGRFEWIPRPIDPDEPLDWTPVWSLASGATRHLPTALLYAGHPEAGADGCCVWDPSGTAAGASFAAAVLRGLLEAVERDAVAIWWYNRLSRPAVAIESADDPWRGRVLEYCRSQQRDLWALDLTTDVGIPCVAAVSRSTGPGPEAVVFGFGADLDPGVALHRAVAELGQVLIHVTDAGRAGRPLDPSLARWLSVASCASEPYLVAAPPAPSRSDAPSSGARDPADDLATVIGLLADRGLEPFVVDQTRPDIGLPVARVVVPGLRHFRARFAPGRLYTVAVTTGWRSEPCPESDLNPIAFFL